MILKLQKKISKLQKEMNNAFRDAQAELSRESEYRRRHAHMSAQRLARFKQDRPIAALQDQQASNNQDTSSLQDEKFHKENSKLWNVDYEE
jgi:hypothetical protein